MDRMKTIVGALVLLALLSGPARAGFTEGEAVEVEVTDRAVREGWWPRAETLPATLAATLYPDSALASVYLDGGDLLVVPRALVVGAPPLPPVPALRRGQRLCSGAYPRGLSFRGARRSRIPSLLEGDREFVFRSGRSTTTWSETALRVELHRGVLRYCR
jgi:hypothetical protein